MKSNMSKAEEWALKVYPKESEFLSDENGNLISSDDNFWVREAFRYGYEQAERNLALTWEDIKVICDIEIAMYPHGIEMYSKEYYQEVLRRFNETRK